MSFEEYLRREGWEERRPSWLQKGDWVVVFDPGGWLIVGTAGNPRVFDVPTPDEERHLWTLDLIEHLCATDDELRKLRGA